MMTDDIYCMYCYYAFGKPKKPKTAFIPRVYPSYKLKVSLPVPVRTRVLYKNLRDPPPPKYTYTFNLPPPVWLCPLSVNPRSRWLYVTRLVLPVFAFPSSFAGRRR
jgi:hypothetical protein